MHIFKRGDLVEFKYLGHILTGTIDTFNVMTKLVSIRTLESIILNVKEDALIIIKAFDSSLNIIKKNIWDDFDYLDYVCITTNSIVKTNGSLVMGAGIALQASKRDKDLQQSFGSQILALNKVNKVYGLLVCKKYLAFQTKTHYQNPSNIPLLQFSVDKLTRLAKKYPNLSFGLPYPCINNGRLTKNEVYPFIKNLPSNVTVYYQ